MLAALEYVRLLGSVAGRLECEELREHLNQVRWFLHEIVRPHQDIEEAQLYPAIESIVGNLIAVTETMRIEHEAIYRWMDELDRAATGGPDQHSREPLTRLLTTVADVGILHVEKEQRVFVALVRQLPDRESLELLSRLHNASCATGHRKLYGIIFERKVALERTLSVQIQLTPRQREILSRIADGATARMIARELGITERTARNHISGILARLECHSQLEAVALARRGGILSRCCTCTACPRATSVRR